MSPEQKLRLACVGLGYWGPNLLRNFSSNSRCEVVLACDQSEAMRAKARSIQPGLKTGTELEEAISEKGVQALVLATPAAMHYAHVKKALEAGKHVFVEKPLALSASEARDLDALARSKKLILMVGHVYEYNAAVRHVHKMILAGELGKIHYVYSQRLNLGRVRHDLDAIWNLAPHDISILNLWLGGAPVAVTAWGITALPHRFADVGFILLEYASGVRAHIQVSWLDPSKIRKATVVGSKKMVVYDDVEMESPVRIYDHGVDVSEETTPKGFGEFKMQLRSGDVHLPKIQASEPLRVECDHFIESVLSGKEALTHGGKGVEVVAVLEAVSASIAKGGVRVELPKP